MKSLHSGVAGFCWFLASATSMPALAEDSPELVVKKRFEATAHHDVDAIAALYAPDASAVLYAYVPDVAETHRRAVEAGARTIELPADTPYGDRRATLEDRWGNTWQVATRSTAF